MENQFFDHPILNSPYEYPRRYWELDEDGQPTQKIIDARRGAEFITPIPKPKKVKKKGGQTQREMIFDEGKGLSTEQQQYDRWDSAEFTDVYEIEADFEAKVRQKFDEMIDTAVQRRRNGQ